MNKAVQEALASGFLEKLAQENLPSEFSDEDIDVNAAVVNLKPPDQMRFVLAAELVDFCGPGPINLINLNFDVTVDITVDPPVNGKIKLTIAEPDTDYDNTDVALCALFSLIDAVSIVFAYEFVILVFNAVSLGLDSEHESVIGVSTVFEPNELVPGTELLPRMEILQRTVSDDSLEMFGRMDLRPDVSRTFVYVRVVEVETVTPLTHVTRPLAGATVQAFDQDLPAPQGDDISIPKASFTEIRTAKSVKTVKVSYKPPRFDELLKEGVTNADGRVQLVFNPKTKGGSKITTQTTRYADPEKADVTEVFESPISEARPDLYFRLTLPDGRVFDSRTLAGGLSLVINAGPGRVSQPGAPLTLKLRKGPVIGLTS